MEVLLFIFYIFPAGFIIGFLLGLWFLRKLGRAKQILLSIVIGIFFGYFVAPVTVGTIGPIIREKRLQNKIKNTRQEAEYFNLALTGTYAKAEILDHYSKHPLSYEGSWQLLVDGPSKLGTKSKKEEIKSEQIEILAKIFANNSHILKLLSTLPNASLLLKLQATEMQSEKEDATANNYIASDEATPHAVLITLAALSPLDTAELVLNNRSAPSYAHEIISIRKTYNTDIANKYQNMAPPGYISKDEKAAWDFFSHHHKLEVVSYIARHQAVPRNVLEFIANNYSDEMVLASVYLSKRTTQEINKDIKERFPNTISYILSESTNGRSQFRMDIASSSFSSPQILENQIKYGYDSHLVFVEIAKNRNVTPSILTSLAKTSYTDVKKLVAQNLLTPKLVLENLATDNDPEVAIAAETNLKRPTSSVER